MAQTSAPSKWRLYSGLADWRFLMRVAENIFDRESSDSYASACADLLLEVCRPCECKIFQRLCCVLRNSACFFLYLFLESLRCLACKSSISIFWCTRGQHFSGQEIRLLCFRAPLLLSLSLSLSPSPSLCSVSASCHPLHRSLALQYLHSLFLFGCHGVLVFGCYMTTAYGSLSVSHGASHMHHRLLTYHRPALSCVCVCVVRFE